VDATDLAIYQHLSPDGQARFWASRRIVDPRVTAREIAGKVGLSEAGVRARLTNLKAEGFLRGTQLGVNPSLFDAEIVVSEVPIERPQDSSRLLHELADVDGVVFARDLLDEQDRKILVYYISDGPLATARRTRLIERFSPTSSLRGPTPYWIPSCDRALTELDWRLLAVFRARPDDSLSGFAARARLSLKTTSRRFTSLLDARACWWSHSNDSSEWPLALLQITVDADADPDRTAELLGREIKAWLPVASDGFGIDPRAKRRQVAGLVPVSGPAALEGLVQRALSLEGVHDVHRTFGLRSASYPGWFDEHLSAKTPRNA